MNSAHPQVIAVSEILGGATIVAMPWWVQFIADVTPILTFITLACGAIIGIAGVVRLFYSLRAGPIPKDEA